jgi:hypothetical protein
MPYIVVYTIALIHNQVTFIKSSLTHVYNFKLGCGFEILTNLPQ